MVCMKGFLDRSLCIELLRSCSTRAHLLQLHSRLVTTSLADDPFLSSTLLSKVALHSLQDLAYALLLFHHLRHRCTSHYNTIIRAFSLSNTPEKSLFFYRDMLRNGIRTDPVSASFALKSCTRLGSLMGGEQIHEQITQGGHQQDPILMTSLIGCYASCRNETYARKVFDEMPVKDTVAWNVLISGYVGKERTRQALELFDVMQSPPYCLRPDDVTCLLMVQACAQSSVLHFGERIHRFIDEHGYGSALNLRNSLIAMYSKCGEVEKAFDVFSGTQNKNVVSWSAMISGLSWNGYGRDALAAFEEMQRAGVAPDEQTFTGVLSACSHCGLVQQGMDFFRMIQTDFGITPNIHHYGCVVDLLSRAGFLDEAYTFIMNSMTVKPDPTIWRTLLGACKVYRHFDLGERVIKHLIEIKAQEAGDYVLLLNTYASVGKWEKVSEMRELMKVKGIQTSPGCSTTELHGTVHEFVADDVSHPQKTDIYKMLDEIEKQLKIAGYVKNVEAELHDLDSGAKEAALSYHSEKLAIAFGVLSTPPGTTIRVTKNVRICLDCHSFSKILSSVYNRAVIIRDRSRFHHFREGRCSCNDFW